MKLWLSPHDDDAELFGAFTLIRERPLVVICLDSYVQPERGIPGTDALTRAHETIAGLSCLNPLLESFRLDIRDDLDSFVMRNTLCVKLLRLIEQRSIAPELVWAPAIEAGGHPHHSLVGEVAAKFWPGRVTHYLTYTNRGKSTDGIEVLPDDGEWITRKLRALACHGSQMTMDPRCGCWPHFLGGLREYVQR